MPFNLLILWNITLESIIDQENNWRRSVAWVLMRITPSNISQNCSGQDDMKTVRLFLAARDRVGFRRWFCLTCSVHTESCSDILHDIVTELINIFGVLIIFLVGSNLGSGTLLYEFQLTLFHPSIHFIYWYYSYGEKINSPYVGLNAFTR